MLTRENRDPRRLVASIIRTIFAQPDLEHIEKQLREVTTMLGRSHPKVAAMLVEAQPDLLAFESCEDPEDELSGCGRGVDRCALAGEHLVADVAVGEVVHRIDQVAQVSAKPVKLPDYERVAPAQRFQAGRQVWAVVLLAGGMVLVEVVWAGPATSSASRWTSVLCDPSAFDTRMYPMSMLDHCHLYVRLRDRVISPSRKTETVTQPVIYSPYRKRCRNSPM